MLVEPLIPPITDPLGRHWKQPARNAIVIDDTHALMDGRTFDALADYSRSFPSGVYPGKMWKAILHDGSAWLRWYGYAGPGMDPKRYCSNNERRILLTDGA